MLNLSSTFVVTSKSTLEKKKIIIIMIIFLKSVPFVIHLLEMCTVDMVYLDYSKDIDLMSHVLLLKNFYMLGFDTNLIDWVQTFLQGRFMNVSMAGILSVEVAVTLGVSQGSVIRPLLFLIYVNYITKDVTGSLAAYTDDFELSICYPYRAGG